jgi:hypothetical protein
MQAALISPISLLGHTEIPSTQYHLVLPHLLSRPKYRQHFRKAEGFKILDNGVAEGVHTHAELLFDLAEVVGADEIVVPDVMMHADATINHADRFQSHITPQREATYSFMGVCQGNSLDEILECADALHRLGYINTFGIPRCYGNAFGVAARGLVYKYLWEAYGDSHEYHFLGCTKHMNELELLKNYPEVRGIDSSLPFVLAMEGLNFQDEEYVDRQPAYFDRHFSDGQRRHAATNVRHFIEAASGGAV